MIGKAPNTGIVPRVTEEMFNRIARTKSDTKHYEVTYSMLEIYNEKVRDLLVPEEQSPNGGLKVRERPNGECYAEGQKDMPVSGYQQIEKWMDYGNKNKTIGATKMNKESSRSHTVITIKFKQIELINGKQSIKSPVINLVDLAGSEKATQTGAEGDRLKEGIAINKSLTTLGMCINILSEKASGKAKKEVVPFRNSVLTRLLQNALGGNSKTIMICALSPASSNYEETLNTLRYAERAKKIELKATIVESAQDKLIRELKNEIEKLRGQISGGGPAGGTNTVEEAERLKAELQASQQAMADMQKTWEERLQESQKKQAEAASSVAIVGPAVDLTKPHIINVSEDAMLSGKIAHSFEKPILVGKKTGNPVPQIILGSIAIRPNHAIFEKEGDSVVLSPATPECAENIFINGKKIEGKTVLQHRDRIIFGTNSAFLFKDPTKAESKDEPDVEYETIMQEKYEKTEQLAMELNAKKEEEEKKAEYERLKQELEQKAKNAAEEMAKEKQQEYEAKLRELEERTKKEQEEKQEKKLTKKKESEKKYLEERLSKILPLIKEANLCAKEFKRNIAIDIKLAKELPDWMGKKIAADLEKARVNIQVWVNNKEQGTHYVWSEDKFMDRLEVIRDLINNYFDTGEIPKWTPENDPFWDDPEAELIGQGYLQLKYLAYLLENETKLNLINSSAAKVGALQVRFKPTDSTGETDPEEEPEDPRELLKKAIYFTLSIDRATGLPKGYQDIFCQYKLPYPTQTFTTQKALGASRDPEFKFSQRHSYDYVTETLLDFLQESAICIKVYGYSEQAKQAAAAPLKLTENEIKKEPSPKANHEENKEEHKDKIVDKPESSTSVKKVDKTISDTPTNKPTEAEGKDKKPVTTVEKSNVLQLSLINSQADAVGQSKYFFLYHTHIIF
eukprot:TRINITY_DN64469_c3_g1_i1.p1 TRINITY_DN64469_c3_g1~~TRINITY_DN64469_c3_g1_i1.p1  ORF type:complete len:908 (+),score=152.19 TRINITY_DN64469_c3_g1_i1:1717-4440(+)